MSPHRIDWWKNPETLLCHFYIIITWFLSHLHSLFLHHYYNIITHYYIFYSRMIITYYYKIIITYNYIIITPLLHRYYTIIISLLQKGNHVIMITLLRVMQSASHCCHAIIIYYCVIITPGSIITHYYLFQSPELARCVILRTAPPLPLCLVLCLPPTPRGLRRPFPLARRLPPLLKSSTWSTSSSHLILEPWPLSLPVLLATAARTTPALLVAPRIRKSSVSSGFCNPRSPACIASSPW